MKSSATSGRHLSKFEKIALKVSPPTAMDRIWVVRPIGWHFVELFSWLQKRFRPSDPDTMTDTALEGLASSSGENRWRTIRVKGLVENKRARFLCPMAYMTRTRVSTVSILELNIRLLIKQWRWRNNKQRRQKIPGIRRRTKTVPKWRSVFQIPGISNRHYLLYHFYQNNDNVLVLKWEKFEVA